MKNLVFLAVAVLLVTGQALADSKLPASFPFGYTCLSNFMFADQRLKLKGSKQASSCVPGSQKDTSDGP